MTSRERVVAALNHEHPDRVPVSLGGTAHKLSNSRTLALREHFGLEGEPPLVLTGPGFSYYDTEVLDRLGTDIRHVFLRPPDGFRTERAPDGGWLDEWGLSYKQADMMWELGGTPFADFTAEDLRCFQGPDPSRPELVAGLADEARHLAEGTDYAVAAYRPLYSGIFELAQMLRGTEKLLIELLTETELVEALFERLTDVQISFYDVLLDAVGEYLQIVEYADDLGTQSAPLISPKTYRALIKPCHVRIIDSIRAKAPHVKIMLHSCGSVRKFIPDFIEAGFDMLNPIQTAAGGMEPAELKAEFGNGLVFLGGVDVQQKMRGSAETVREEVRSLIQAMGKGGGYVLAPSHNFGDDVPLKNILAFFEVDRTVA
jgi:uroporphyrinogen decarboxylase